MDVPGCTSNPDTAAESWKPIAIGACQDKDCCEYVELTIQVRVGNNEPIDGITSESHCHNLSCQTETLKRLSIILPT